MDMEFLIANVNKTFQRGFWLLDKQATKPNYTKHHSTAHKLNINT
jgi:hypothetical protein